MVLRSTNPWETTTLSSLISIGTHKLHINTSGPVRKPGTPVAIFITGAGAPAIEHIRLQRLLSSFVRVYFYDRAGYDRSERGPNKLLTATNASEELHTLMHNGIQVPPPYILVSHSYGGIVARQYLALYPNDIFGLVLADTATELLYELSPGVFGKELEPLVKGVDLLEVTKIRERSRLTDEEWDEAMSAIERTDTNLADEDHRGSGKTLSLYQQFRHHPLGSKPLCVIRCNFARDFTIQYNAGVAAGNGTEEEREACRKLIEKWDIFDDQVRAAQLRLGRNRRYTVHDDLGHDFIIGEPECLVEDVRWVLKGGNVDLFGKD